MFPFVVCNKSSNNRGRGTAGGTLLWNLSALVFAVDGLQKKSRARSAVFVQSPFEL
ncbi:uncharacterized protein BDV17DRAFT_256759 [Aspergillus undulatus]|uniref:uncharacterized protein n=1 Tax=Aspergillus undulatus TaxID=1810928 RepID=UPI003CCCB4B4